MRRQLAQLYYRMSTDLGLKGWEPFPWKNLGDTDEDRNRAGVTPDPDLWTKSNFGCRVVLDIPSPHHVLFFAAVHVCVRARCMPYHTIPYHTISYHTTHIHHTCGTLHGVCAQV